MGEDCVGKKTGGHWSYQWTGQSGRDNWTLRGVEKSVIFKVLNPGIRITYLTDGILPPAQNWWWLLPLNFVMLVVVVLGGQRVERVTTDQMKHHDDQL